jgi:thioredoxin reductase (NADPH)
LIMKMERTMVSGEVLVSGTQGTPELHRTLCVLSHNLVPFSRIEEAPLVTDAADSANSQVVVVFPNGERLLDPSCEQLGAALHLHMAPKFDQYDLVVIGSGPAGLAAGIYGASEGLNTLIIDRDGPGGQAGTSSRIENYPGFPNGISGHDLTLMAVNQAERLGAELVTLRAVTKVTDNGPTKTVALSNGTEIRAKAVIIATGMTPKALTAPGLLRLKDAGIYYGAGSEEVDGAKGTQVIIVGGANSAGQAALNFVEHGAIVHLVVRGASLEKDMSDYLCERIARNTAIQVHTETVVAEASGPAHLRSVTLKNERSGVTLEMKADHMLVFIGAVPSADWCNVARDAQGYVLSGRDLGSHWTVPDRAPFDGETSMPGVFTAGDVEHGELHRVAIAVGSGARAVANVHKYLATLA